MSEFDQVRATWDDFAAVDPYWAVLSNDLHLGGRGLAEFLESGRRDVRRCLDLLADLGVDPVTSAVDFGCGVGRLSGPLADEVAEVIGLDVSRTMLELARTTVAAGRPGLQLRQVVGPDLPVDDDAVDLAISLIVLQHLPLRLAVGSLLELVRVVRPGGHVVVQVPTRLLRAEPVPAGARRAGISLVDPPTALLPGERAVLSVVVTNTSDVAWPAGFGFNCGNHWARDGVVHTVDDGRTQLATALEPGGSLALELVVTAPTDPGHHELVVDLVHEMVAWWADSGSAAARTPLQVVARAGDARAGVAAEPEPATDPSAPPPDDAADEAPDDAPADAPAAAARIQEAEMPMHALAPELVRALLEHAGCTVVREEPDTMAGPDWESTTFVARVGA